MTAGPRQRSGFSLTEVVIAIGIVSFALVAVVGLLPAGLQAVKHSNDQAGAAQVVTAIADAVRNARGSNGTYSFTYAGKNATYTLGGPPTTCEWKDLTLQGDTGTTKNPKRLFASLILAPPANAASAGTATLSVAWSAQSPNLQLNTTTLTWSNAEGSLTSGLIFVPKP